MFLEYDLFIGIGIGFLLGVIITMMISMRKKSRVEEFEDNLNIDGRISPFVKVHQDLLVEPSHEQRKISRRRLEQKIESFKQRNRFYQ